jgi:hypothetical protein
MEKLSQDLFKDASIETSANRTGGKVCDSQIGGNSYCPTNPGTLDLVDIGGG